MDDTTDDRLTRMMTRQRRAQQDVHGYDLEGMTLRERVDFVHWNVTAAVAELHEALAETSWKPWANGDRLDREAFVGELTDVWHFLMNLLLVVDVTPEELLRRYEVKRKINDDRQVAGYDAVSGKCPVCRRALDDPAVDCEPGICRKGGAA